MGPLSASHAASSDDQSLASQSWSPVMLVLPQGILEEARQFFEGAGVLGHEGTALLAGRIHAGDQRVSRIVIPDQAAGGGTGCWVEVTDTGKLQIAAALDMGERWLARIHSHPGRAFHSATD